MILRDWIQDDVSVFAHWQQLGHKWQEFDGPYYKRSNDDLKAKIKKLEESISANSFPSPRSRLVIADKNTNKLLGTVNSYWESKETHWLCAGISLYDEKTWGQGFGFEALGLWCDYLFAENKEIARLDFRTWSGNHGMVHLAKELGFRTPLEVHQELSRNVAISS